MIWTDNLIDCLAQEVGPVARAEAFADHAARHPDRDPLGGSRPGRR